MKLKALSPIKHNGKRIAEGKTFDVEDDDQAQALIDNGSAAKPGSAKSRDDGDDGGGLDDPKTVKVVSTTPAPSKVTQATK